MKNLIVVLTVCVVLLCSCKGCGERQQQCEALATGDLVFVLLPIDYSLSLTPDSVALLMQEQTDSSVMQCIHVAMVEARGDSTFIVDATARRGVACYPLADFVETFTLKGGELPIFKVMRLAEGDEGARFIANAKRYEGRPYDVDFCLDNDAQYCSELVRNAFVAANGDTLFALSAMDFGEGRGALSRYWNDLAAALGCTIPQGQCGITPYDIMHDARLRIVHVDDLLWARAGKK